MTALLAIDPGPEMSAFVMFSGSGKIELFGHEPNAVVILQVIAARDTYRLAIEMIASYGMPVGREVFETCVWIGRMLEAYGDDKRAKLVYRKDVKMALCGSTRANDANIRQSLIDRYGPGKDRAIGKKASKGPLYGISGDVWSALAVAETYRMTAA